MGQQNYDKLREKHARLVTEFKKFVAKAEGQKQLFKDKTEEYQRVYKEKVAKIHNEKGRQLELAVKEAKVEKQREIEELMKKCEVEKEAAIRDATSGGSSVKQEHFSQESASKNNEMIKTLQNLLREKEEELKRVKLEPSSANNSNGGGELSEENTKLKKELYNVKLRYKSLSDNARKKIESLNSQLKSKTELEQRLESMQSQHVKDLIAKDRMIEEIQQELDQMTRNAGKSEPTSTTPASGSSIIRAAFNESTNSTMKMYAESLEKELEKYKNVEKKRKEENQILLTENNKMRHELRKRNAKTVGNNGNNNKSLINNGASEKTNGKQQAVVNNGTKISTGGPLKDNSNITAATKQDNGNNASEDQCAQQ